MKTGALIFAFNNEKTNYVDLARWSAQRIHRHLSIPVAIVTDTQSTSRLDGVCEYVIDSEPEIGGTRYFEDYQDHVTWFNAGRTSAFDLTPWDQTLVLDADYVVASNQLKSVLDSSANFVCHREAFDLTTGQHMSGLDTFGNYQMPMWWATVMMFRKSNIAEYIFGAMAMIKQNWNHYRAIYHIGSNTYRNDFALSIALNIVSGHTLEVDSIPWRLASVKPEVKVSAVTQDQFQFEFLDAQQRPRRSLFGGFDFHAMGKQQLEAIIANSC